MTDEIDKFAAALAYIEDGLRIMSLAPNPDYKRIEWWTREAVTLKEQIAREQAEKEGPGESA
jgi:hypothetical protein